MSRDEPTDPTFMSSNLGEGLPQALDEWDALQRGVGMRVLFNFES